MPPKKQPTGDYEVGYARPPEATRFQTGLSGNPKGKPKGRRNRKKVLSYWLEQPITVVLDGKRVKLSNDEALMIADIKRALKGDNKAHDRILRRKLQAGLIEPEIQKVEEDLAEHDRHALEFLLQQHLRKNGPTP
ncbi:DUF5681 domain-containing protein [Microvirga sp. 2YAF29]|uniref:DUF5681 domain-containing protein n=1 Tax=Microvirga sp. 2YAF29 TaxID=3233031 RepID=UPI003F99A7A9